MNRGEGMNAEIIMRIESNRIGSNQINKDNVPDPNN